MLMRVAVLLSTKYKEIYSWKIEHIKTCREFYISGVESSMNGVRQSS